MKPHDRILCPECHNPAAIADGLVSGLTIGGRFTCSEWKCPTCGHVMAEWAIAYQLKPSWSELEEAAYPGLGEVDQHSTPQGKDGD